MSSFLQLRLRGSRSCGSMMFPIVVLNGVDGSGCGRPQQYREWIHSRMMMPTAMVMAGAAAATSGLLLLGNTTTSDTYQQDAELRPEQNTNNGEIVENSDRYRRWFCSRWNQILSSLVLLSYNDRKEQRNLVQCEAIHHHHHHEKHSTDVSPSSLQKFSSLSLSSSEYTQTHPRAMAGDDAFVAKYDNTSPAGAATPATAMTLPSWEAMVRASRLVETVLLMTMDYQLAAWDRKREKVLTTSIMATRRGRTGSVIPDDNKIRSNQLADGEGDDDCQEDSVTYWEDQITIREQVLREAQAAYASGGHNIGVEAEDVARVNVDKRARKRIMLEAAQSLAWAEEQLHRLAAEGQTGRASAVHRKASQRLLQLCHVNRGVYIKIGQHLANLDYLLPAEYIETMSALFDDNPRTDWEHVRAVIRDEFDGAEVEDLFDQFDPEPIASASLAQVHVAYKDGKKLAVKVQHAGLSDTAMKDVRAMQAVVGILQRRFANFNYGWLAQETARLLPKELDFQNEGRNAERAARNMQELGMLDSVVIPKILWHLTSPRVLTMEFEEGFKATDVAAMERAGLNKHETARLIASVFASQVFLSGFVHCDPHPANVLLRAKECSKSGRRGRPEMVLVDHGLYRELDGEFQLQYAMLWKSLMLADIEGIRQACRVLGVEQFYQLFAGMLTSRPFDELLERSRGRGLQKAPTSAARSRADKAVIRGYAQRYLLDIFDLLSKLPRQMLLLLKMNDCLRHIDYALGVSPTNTIWVSGRYAARAVYRHAILSTQQGAAAAAPPDGQFWLQPSWWRFWWQRWVAWWDYVRVVLRIELYEWTVWWYHQNGIQAISATLE